MKKFVLTLVSLGVFLGSGVVTKVNAKVARVTKREPYVVYLIRKLPKQALSPEEVKFLTKMREEEKLAHDVYKELSKKYPLPIFRNIAKSERYHMYLMGLLLRKYKLQDPIKGMVGRVGEFKSPEFKKLYDVLVKRGDVSLVAALKVGAEIEELDIKDLKEALKVTDNRDIRIAYENLLKASRNHLRAFVRVLKRYGVTYEPKYLSKKELEEILSVKHEAGVYGAKGRPYVLSTKVEISGKVIKIKEVEGFARKKIMWWAIDVKGRDGKVYEVRLVPKWVYGSLNKLKEGEEVKVLGYRPPYWIVRGIPSVMACKLETLDGKVIYDFNFRKVCKKIEGK